MPITTNAGFDAAAAAPVFGVLHLVELDFLGQTLYYTNWPVDVVVSAKTYIGVGSIGNVGAIKESEDGSVQNVELELSQVNVANLALALGPVTSYQDRDMRIYEALTDSSLAIQGTPVLRFAGRMNFIKVTRDKDTNAGRITLVCSTAGYDVRKNPTGLRMNDSQHQAAHPGELGFSYTQDLIGRPQLWISKRFQQVPT